MNITPMLLFALVISPCAAMALGFWWGWRKGFDMGQKIQPEPVTVNVPDKKEAVRELKEQIEHDEKLPTDEELARLDDK